MMSARGFGGRAMAYASQSDVEFRMAPSQIPRRALHVSSVSTTTDILTSDGHGIATDDVVTFRAESGGTLPSPLVAGASYYGLHLTDATFQVSASEGGAAINLTTAGSNVLVVKQIPWARALTWANAIVTDALGSTAAVPLSSPYPQVVVEVEAELAAQWLRQWGGVDTSQLAERITWAQSVLDRWKRGVPVRGPNAPTGANQAVRASTTTVDTRGWTRTPGSIP